jgi:hypothetical protein
VRKHGCILVVRALLTDETLWPPILKDEDDNSLIGFFFHERPGNEDTDPFGYPEPQPGDREFYKALAGLRTIVRQRLRDIKAHAEHLDNDAFEVSVEAPRVYLDALPEQAEEWQEAAKLLMRSGFEVLPSSPPQRASTVFEIRRHKQQTQQDVDRCRAILVLDGEQIERRCNAAINNARNVNRASKPKVAVISTKGFDGQSPIDQHFDLADNDWLERMVGWLDERDVRFA